LIDTLLARLLAVSPRRDTRQVLIDAVTPVAPAQRVQLACRLIVTTPEYQLA